MSVADLWGEPRAASQCNIATVQHRLDDLDLLAPGQLSTGDFTDNDNDRARIFRFICHQPQGILRSTLVNYVLKGTRYYPDGPGWDDFDGNDLEAHLSDLEALDGSDADYQLAYRFTRKLASADLARLEASPAGIVVYPTIEALDLISQGKTARVSDDAEPIYDRDFCRSILQTLRSPLKALSEPQKETLARSLRRYIRRIDQYRLVFDVHLTGSRGVDTERMTKRYKTRWNSEGRQKKAFARYSQSLRTGYKSADNAVFATLTTDPKKHDSLLDAIESINSNFHSLCSFMRTDPETVANTRRESVPGWRPDLDSSNFHFGATGAVSGRPREKLEYLKVLEFTEKGYPHLHVLFFDVPTRDSDGMPFLIDKDELSARWNRYGQGRIVDLYPLTYRDDLDELGDFGYTLAHDSNGQILRDDDDKPIEEPVDEGFVCWYQYGNHDHSAEWAEQKARYHKNEGHIDMMGDDDVLREKTAGAYLGKYMSEMFKTMRTNNTGIGKDGFDHDDDAAWWKLALYWATNRQLWSVSQGIADAIRLEDDELDPDVATGVHWATKLSLADAALAESRSDARQNDYPSNKIESASHRIISGLVATPDASAVSDDRAIDEIIRDTYAEIQFLGAFPEWDLPSPMLTAMPLESLEAAAFDDSEDIHISHRGDRPPPVQSLYPAD